jgi:hypothetical protein
MDKLAQPKKILFRELRGHDLAAVTVSFIFRNIHIL